MSRFNQTEREFVDKMGYTQKLVIREKLNVFLSIDSFLNGIQTGYARFYPNYEDQIFLDVIYCFDSFRQRGVASKLSETADEFLAPYEGYIIRGEYAPQQLSQDREDNVPRSEEDLELSARSFYEKCGYTIVSKEEYLRSPEEYPDIDEGIFAFGEGYVSTVVYKKIGIKKEKSR